MMRRLSWSNRELLVILRLGHRRIEKRFVVTSCFDELLVQLGEIVCKPR